MMTPFLQEPALKKYLYLFWFGSITNCPEHKESKRWVNICTWSKYLEQQLINTAHKAGLMPKIHSTWVNSYYF